MIYLSRKKPGGSCIWAQKTATTGSSNHSLTWTLNSKLKPSNRPITVARGRSLPLCPDRGVDSFRDRQALGHLCEICDGRLDESGTICPALRGKRPIPNLYGSGRQRFSCWRVQPAGLTGVCCGAGQSRPLFGEQSEAIRMVSHLVEKVGHARNPSTKSGGIPLQIDGLHEPLAASSDPNSRCS